MPRKPKAEPHTGVYQKIKDSPYCGSAGQTSRVGGVPSALAILDRMHKVHARLRHPADARLFMSKRNKPIASPRKWFATALKQAGIEGVSWHILRHTFASRPVMNRVPLHEVSKLMGHNSLSQAQRYAHLAPAIQLEALECLVPKPGTIPVQDGSQIGSLAKRFAFKPTSDVAVSITL